MVYSDIISFFEGLINDLGHYATEQDVELNFSSNISHLNVSRVQGYIRSLNNVKKTLNFSLSKKTSNFLSDIFLH